MPRTQGTGPSKLNLLCFHLTPYVSGMAPKLDLAPQVILSSWDLQVWDPQVLWLPLRAASSNRSLLISNQPNIYVQRL